MPDNRFEILANRTRMRSDEIYRTLKQSKPIKTNSARNASETMHDENLFISIPIIIQQCQHEVTRLFWQSKSITGEQIVDKLEEFFRKVTDLLIRTGLEVTGTMDDLTSDTEEENNCSSKQTLSPNEVLALIALGKNKKDRDTVAEKLRALPAEEFLAIGKKGALDDWFETPDGGPLRDSEGNLRYDRTKLRNSKYYNNMMLFQDFKAVEKVVCAGEEASEKIARHLSTHAR